MYIDRINDLHIWCGSYDVMESPINMEHDEKEQLLKRIERLERRCIQLSACIEDIVHSDLFEGVEDDPDAWRMKVTKDQILDALRGDEE